ncbi:serine/threonine protein kinase [Argonema galeatum]|uniref:serine/threonine protein kinase n=1 Tax=Argonema galeatum TaxID=2942762 RepID=UPI002011EDD5|nr:serine/threonine-protein kinase [Argonema galeatum]MCL1462872.1 serine/threonine protein kinase [Argonema galeatum A003/A1]
MELLHQPGEIIAQRYRILDTLGQGGVGITYQAQDLQNSQQVALKALSLRRMADWKVLELFEREARILSELNHPGIPRYLDYFQMDTVEDRSFYIVQQLAPGKTLAALVESGWKPDEAEVKSLAIQILEILVYLHSLTPPVIHRDIKPQNIILRSPLAPLNKGGKQSQIAPLRKGDKDQDILAPLERSIRATDVSIRKGDKDQDILAPLVKGGWGDLFLVDFGAVQDTYHNTVTGGSTVVGTYGYMAPEQFRGQAVLSTDLYGLGTTILFLLTGKSPADLPQRKLKINFRSHVRVSSEFADWLEKMLSPVIEDRFSSAKQALAVLRGELLISTLRSTKPQKPKDTPITLTKIENKLVVEIPSVWLRNNHSLLFGSIPLVGYGFFLLVLFWIFKEIFPEPLKDINTLFLVIFLTLFGSIGLFILLRIGVRRSGTFLFGGLFCTKLEIDQSNFRLQGKIRGSTQDILQGNLCNIRLPFSKKPFTFCVLQERRRKHRFGLFLTQQENEWLMGEIADFLKEVR